MSSANSSLIGSKDLSPLHKFVDAKKSMTSLFEELNYCLDDVTSFIREASTQFSKNVKNEINDDQTIEKSFDWNSENLEDYVRQVNSIINKCSRDKMKVAFFGRTSNGKSTVINTILGDKILPSGIGHTTSCFLQMQGSETEEPYILTENSHEKRPISSLKQLASALKDECLESSSSVSVYWPILRCPILANDVVFIDSPGVDVNPDLDTWIKQYCIDADLFVLVTNAESTINIAEKNFFHQVNKLVSKPNIFILNNRWDASASEPEDMEAVRSQHLQRGVDFLVKELNCISTNEAHKRIFFTSAREVLNCRVSENSGDGNFDINRQMFGFAERYDEFLHFEETFKKTLSNSAIVTKFEGSCSRGLKIVDNIINFLDNLLKYCDDLCNELNNQIQQIKHVYMSKIKLNQSMNHLQNEVDLAVKAVFRNIYLALCEEVNVINGLVNKYNKQFIDDPEIIVSFKNDLIAFIERGLENNVFKRCSSNVHQIVNDTHQSIYKFIREVNDLDKKVSPDSKNSDNSKILADEIKPINVDWSFRMDLKLLCQEFQGDVNFRFSLSPATIILWVRSLFDKRISQSIQDTTKVKQLTNIKLNNPAFGKNATRDSDIESINNPLNNNDSDSNPEMVHAIGLMTTTTSAMLLIAIGLAWKIIGQRFITTLTGLYAGVYSFERVTWNNNAKRSAYKKQFSAYISKKFGYAVKVASFNCSKNIEKEFESRLETAFQIVSKSITATEYKTTNIENQIVFIKLAQKQAHELRQKFFSLRSKMKSFAIENSFN